MSAAMHIPDEHQVELVLALHTRIAVLRHRRDRVRVREAIKTLRVFPTWAHKDIWQSLRFPVL